MFHVLIWCRIGIFNPKFWCDVYYSGIFKYLKITSWEMQIFKNHQLGDEPHRTLHEVGTSKYINLGC